MAVQHRAILLGHAQPFNNSCRAHESSAHFFRQFTVDGLQIRLVGLFSG